MTIEIDLNSDTEQLLKAFEAGDVLADGEGGDAPAAPAAAPAAAAAPAPAATVLTDTTDQAQRGQEQEPEPQGVATKDGKHVIPYSVLRGERERAAQAEQEARDLRAQLDAVRAQGTQPAPIGENNGAPPSAGTVPDLTALSDSELEKLKEDFPTVYAATVALKAQADKNAQVLQAIEDRNREDVASKQRSAQELVQDAIDATPVLAHLQANDPAGFKAAVEFDATLRSRPEWQGKTYAERFAKVAELVQSVIGPVEVPGAKAKAATPTADEVRAAAQAMAANQVQANKSAVPTSLSEFPAGNAPASDERQAAEQMSQLQLAEKFGAMTPDQLDAYLEKL